MFNSQSPLASMFQRSTSTIGANSQPADPNGSMLSRSATNNDLVLPTAASPLLSLYNPAAQTGLVQGGSNINQNNSGQPPLYNTAQQNTALFPSQPTAGATSSPNAAAPLDNSLSRLSQLWPDAAQPAATTHAPNVQPTLATYGQTPQDANFQSGQSLREDKGSTPQYLPSFLLGGVTGNPTDSPSSLVSREGSFFGASPYGENASSRRLVETSPGTNQGFRSPAESTQGLLQGRNPYGPPALQRRLSTGSGFGHNDMLTSRRKKEPIPMDMVTVIDDIPPATTLDDLATHTTTQGSDQSAVAANDLPANSTVPPSTGSSFARSNLTGPVPDTVYSTVPIQSLEQHGYKVTVFGFPPTAAQAVLQYFQAFGQVITCTVPTDNANYVTLVYAQPEEAHKALLCNGQIIGDNVMLGVKAGNQRTMDWMVKHKGLGGLWKSVEESAQNTSPSKLARGAGDFFRALTGGLGAHSQQQQSGSSMANNSMLSSMLQEPGGNQVNGQPSTISTTSPSLSTATQFRMSPFNNNTEPQIPGGNTNLPGRSLQQQALLASHYQATNGSRPGDTSLLSTSQLGSVAQPSQSNTTLLRQPSDGTAINGRTSSSPFGQLSGESQQDQPPRSSQPLGSGFSPLFPSATNRGASTTAVSPHQSHNATGGARLTRGENFDPVPPYQLSFARNSQYNPPIDTHTHRNSLNGSFGRASSGAAEEVGTKRRNSSVGPRAAPLPPALRKSSDVKEIPIKPIKLQSLGDKGDEGSAGRMGNTSRNGLWQSAMD
ncbi:hypothetical protein IWQ62_005750, partial [Dispira parvispora]